VNSFSKDWAVFKLLNIFICYILPKIPYKIKQFKKLP